MEECKSNKKVELPNRHFIFYFICSFLSKVKVKPICSISPKSNMIHHERVTQTKIKATEKLQKVKDN